MDTATKTKKTRAAKAIAPTVALRPALPRKEDHSSDWRKIVSPQNIILNSEYYAKLGIDVVALEESEVDRLIKDAPDAALIIKLAGFRQIAQVRGVKSTKFSLSERTDGRAVVSCEMVLAPNEEEPYEVTISGIANCSHGDKMFEWAEAIAGNRAECRAWRQYLNLVSVSYEEIDPDKKHAIQAVPQSALVLEDVLKRSNLTAADIPQLMADGGYELNAKWDGTIASLENSAIFTLMGLIARSTK